MKYVALTQNTFQSGQYSLRPISGSDKNIVLRWRNDQQEVLRQKGVISKTEQAEYFAKKVIPTFEQTQPEMILFMMLNKDSTVAYGGLTHLDWNEKIGEISFLAETSIAKNQDMYAEVMTHFLIMLKRIAFKELRFNQIFAETYGFRTHHIKILESAGLKYGEKINNQIEYQGKFYYSVIHSMMKDEYELEK